MVGPDRSYDVSMCR